MNKSAEDHKEYRYDVFISYNHADREWVWHELMPRLEGAGLKICIDECDFEIGTPSLINMERAVDNSRHTLVVLTPAWIESEWTEFESLLVGITDPAGRRRKLIPLMLEPCRLPPRIAMLTYADFTRPAERAAQMTRLIMSLRPPGRQAHLFICYKRHADPDQKLAAYLHGCLTAQGHHVFVDTTLRTGAAWLNEIDQQIKNSDFLVALLSKESADSEMVQAEVNRAYEYRQLQGRPLVLPVRIAYEGLLPYTIAAFLNPLQYVVWRDEVDNDRVCQDILAAIDGRLLERAPVHARPAVGSFVVSEDGRLVADDESLHPPLPEFDPRFLEELEAPGGAVKLRDRFYIEREADVQLKREVVESGTTITIRAARQTGKSSLLLRGVQYASEHGARVVNLNVQRVDNEYLESPDRFLRYLAESVVRRLHLDVTRVDKMWSDSLGPQDKLTYLMEDYVLPESNVPIVLAMDEVDRLLQTTFHNNFFGMLRSWHEERTRNDQWNKLNIIMVISTEPYLLITDLLQSPFNVGFKHYLEDFSEAQVRDLNRRHGSPVRESEFPRFMVLLNGHPYLTRKALYALVTERWTFDDLFRVAATDEGPFGDHLRRLQWLLRDEQKLRDALKQIIRQERCVDEMVFFRLLRAGLVKGSGEVCKCRCDLYRLYLGDKL